MVANEVDSTHCIRRQSIYARIAAIVFFVVMVIFYVYAIILRGHVPGTDIIHARSCLILASDPSRVVLQQPGHLNTTVFISSRAGGHITAEDSYNQWTKQSANSLIAFAVWHNILVYWVPQDRTLCLLSQKDTKHWLSVKSSLLNAALVMKCDRLQKALC